MRSSEGLFSSFAPDAHARGTVEIMPLLLPSVAICALSSYNWAICGGLCVSQITVCSHVSSSCFHSAHVFYNSRLLRPRVVLSVEETNASFPHSAGFSWFSVRSFHAAQVPVQDLAQSCRPCAEQAVPAPLLCGLPFLLVD